MERKVKRSRQHKNVEQLFVQSVAGLQVTDFSCLVSQLRGSFKELKKRFGNLKFSYLKRTDRTRNSKAVRNQLQQVELYEDKMEASLAPDLNPAF